MQIQLPEQFTTQEEFFLVYILQQVLSPTQSSNFLSGTIFSEMESIRGYMECLLVVLFKLASCTSELCITVITRLMYGS